ncbi:MAG: Na+/H+ antiporter NhaC family protein [Candidatus Sericytochromatia bacterium]|nr:Na+/H+ antiporter NhaC family protein [Candidatus Sericytochromatia bacterium]
MTRTAWGWGLLVLAAGLTLWLATWPSDTLLRALWPALVAMAALVVTRHAVAGLALGVAAAALLLAGGAPLTAARDVLASHLFPALQGPWRLGALGFTLLLGAFAGLLERSGGFEAVLRRLLGDGRAGERRLLLGVYGVGLVCFFDGLASAMLTGRLARPLADRAGVAREKLAWVVDSTSSPVACVSLVSTWIATQLSLIAQGLQGAPFAVAPHTLYLSSIAANPYCLLSLALVPLAVAVRWEPGLMRSCRPATQEAEAPAPAPGPVRAVALPLLVLVPAILLGFPLLGGAPVALTTAAGWQQAFSGDGGPYALVVGSLAGLGAAWWVYPRDREVPAGQAALAGAAALLPALVVLVLAWTLGSQLEALGASSRIAALLAAGPGPQWLPLATFALGAGMAFTTGSSWATMGLLTPLALPATLLAAQQAAWPLEALPGLCAMVIGAVFGGATFGDHCSPFSDTTIVSALASGCSTPAHVATQLPYAGLTAACAALAYAGMGLGLPPLAATLAAGAVLAAGVGVAAWRARPLARV